MSLIKKTNSILIFNVFLLGVLFLFLVLYFLSWLDFYLLIFFAFFSTLPVVLSAVKSLKNKAISVDLLASVALAVSLIDGQWISVLFINLMITSARIFSYYTEARSDSAIKSLFKLKPEKAKVKYGEDIKEIPLSQVKKGDLIIIELGDRIPVDGIIERGEAEIDQSSLTGESLPVSKKIGDRVLSSTIVVSGNLSVVAERVGKESVFEKVISLVEESQSRKTPIHTLSSKFSEWYIVIVFVGSVILFLFSKNLNLILSILLVSCADDIAVAIPLAFMASIAHGAKHGAVIKGGEYLEALAGAKMAIFDKTGTLTTGKLDIHGLIPFGGFSNEEILKSAGVLTVISSHPASRAIINYIKKENIKHGEPRDFQEIAGKGASAVFAGKKIVGGKISFLEESGIKINKDEMNLILLEKEKGFSLFLIAIDGRLAGCFVLASQLRHNAKQAIEKLRQEGISKIVMLTGDNEKIAKRVADTVGIQEFHANLLPEDKLAYLKKYLNKEYKVIMVGDGVNDAATLAMADIGVAMGAVGADAAIESADIALMRDDLTQISELKKISKSTLSVVYQNIWIWGFINAFGIFLVFSGVLNPVSAAAYNFITDFIPLLNSFRLFK